MTTRASELFDMRISVGNVMSIIATVVIVVATFNSTSNTVNELSKTQEKLEKRVDIMEDSFTDIKVQLGRIEERLISLGRGNNGP